MSTITDIGKVREARERLSLPTRTPDLEASLWLKDGEVDWLRTFSPETKGPTPEQTSKLLLDAAWVAAFRDDDEEVDPRAQPVLWYTLDGLGRATFMVAPDAFKDTKLRHGLWLLRAWWRANRYWGRYVVRMARGRG